MVRLIVNGKLVFEGPSFEYAVWLGQIVVPTEPFTYSLERIVSGDVVQSLSGPTPAVYTLGHILGLWK